MASQSAGDLESVARIRDHPLRLNLMPADDLDGYAGDQPGGIFIANPGIAPQRLRDWSERFQTLVFSPFTGDVERGAVAGVSVTDRVLPFVNLPQARRAGIQFQAFFLQVARCLEDD